MYGGDIYWTEWDTLSVKKASLSSPNVTEVVTSQVSNKPTSVLVCFQWRILGGRGTHTPPSVQFFSLPTVNDIYRPQTKLRKGNVLTSMCQEFCPWHPPWTDTSPGQTPPSRWLLQQMVRILLECILVQKVMFSQVCHSVWALWSHAPSRERRAQGWGHGIWQGVGYRGGDRVYLL